MIHSALALMEAELTLRKLAFRLRIRLAHPLLAVVILVVAAQVLMAQTYFGSILGTVTDSSGAVIVGATVDLTNIGTSQHWATNTDSNGNYEFLSLAPGQYRVDVVRQGFRDFARQPIAVQIQSSVRINVRMEVGEASQTVTVSTAAPLIDSATSTLSQMVEGRTVEQLPLDGRNVLNLIELTPGVIAQGGASGNPQGNQLNGAYSNPNGWGNYQIGGGNAGQSASFIDGASINVTYLNATAFVPTQDAIQEFRVETNNVSPEFGRFAGGVVNMITKSGANSFHGSAYDYLRNTVLDANDFFDNQNGLARPNLTQNQYGANLGGPIKKDKAFFFFGWEGYANRAGRPTLTTVPTTQEKSGDFSGSGVQIYDPTTFQEIQCNGVMDVICPNRIDPTATATLGYWLAPNLPGGTNNFDTNAKVGGNQNQYNLQVDYHASEKQQLFGHFGRWSGNSVSLNPFKNDTGFPLSSFTSTLLVLGDTYQFNPKTVGDFRIAYLRFGYGTIPLSSGIDLSPFGTNWANLSDQIVLRSAPEPLVSGMANEIFQFMDVAIDNTNDNYSISASLSKIVGRHTLKFGGEARRLEWYFVQSNLPSAGFAFTGAFTSLGAPPTDHEEVRSFADYLLGYPVLSESQQATRVSMLQTYQGYYAQDNFRANGRLTLNLGARWELPGAFYEKHDRATVLLPDAADPLSQTIGMPINGQIALVNSPLRHDRHTQDFKYDLFAPRVGFALGLNPTTVLRGGYGVNYLPNDVAFNAGPWASPVNNAITEIFAALPPNSTLSDPFPNGILQPAGRNQSYLTSLEGQVVQSPVPNQTYPYVQQWNLNLEQQVGSSASFQIAYAAAKGTHLPFNSLELDQIPDKYDSMGASLFNQVSNPFENLLPGGTLNGPTVQQGQLLRPFPQFTSFGAEGFREGSSNYQALQASYEKRFSLGAAIIGSYTWSKFLGNVDSLQAFLEQGTPGAVQDNNDLSREWSLTSYDVPHRFVTGYIVDLPLGKKKKWLADVNGFSDKLISGWGVGGITTLQSGFPLPMTAIWPAQSLASFGAGTLRPDVVNGCHKSMNGSAQTRLNGWFNTSCFVNTPSGFEYGNESRTDSELRSAGIANWDFSVFKGTTLQDRYHLEFRAEGFNIFNRVQFGPPGTQLGTSSFGVVNSQLNQPRLIQFALRLRL